MFTRERVGVAEFKRVCVGANSVLVVVFWMIWFRAGSLGRAQESQGSFGTLVLNLCTYGSFAFAWVHSGACSYRQFHWGSRVFTRERVVFAGFIGDRA